MAQEERKLMKMDSDFSRMLRQVRVWSSLFCLLVSALPLHLASRPEMAVGGSSTSRGIRRVVSRADQPWEFWGVVALAAGAAALCWWFRAKVVRGLAAQAATETDKSSDEL